MITIVTLSSCKNEVSKSNLEGKWKITSKPSWVKSAYLAHKSDIYEFREDGNCMFGTAGGTYEILEMKTMKVNFPIQQATPGFVGMFGFKIKNKVLTIINSNETEQLILKKIK